VSEKMSETTLQSDHPAVSHSKTIDHVIAGLAVGSGVASLGLFGLFLAGRMHWFQMGWSGAGILAWDAVLSMVFFLQHSGMVRRGFKARFARVIPERYQGAVYSISSGVALTAVSIFWQASPVQWYSVHGALRGVFTGITLLALGLGAWSFAALHLFDPFGVRALGPARAETRGGSAKLIMRGPYRWVRHPLYFAALIIIWFAPSFSADRLLFNVLWTAWIWIGAALEEVGLAGEFGDPYQQYRKKVPMLFPYRGAIKNESD
jgi:methanethiol S-methyltransferase